MTFTEFLIKYYFRKPIDWLIPLGSEYQRGALGAKVYSKDVWKNEKILKKIKSLILLKWTPTEEIIEALARHYLIYELFGGPNNFGDQVFKLMVWHFSQTWSEALTEQDKIKTSALNAMSMTTLLRYNKYPPELFGLNLGLKAPRICYLAYPMIVKVPLISIRNFVHIDSDFAFNSIRKSNHPCADKIITYLYEILLLQQKTAISLYELYDKIKYIEKHKGDSLFISAEINAIMHADTIFPYLKASIEKILVLVGYIHEIMNIDSKKNHKARISCLNTVPIEIKETDYFKFIIEYTSSENLEQINNYRSGLLHKLGIADLQPHKYVGEKATDVTLKTIYEILLEQHSKNSAILICALALLTDRLCILDPPSYKYEDIPLDKEWIKNYIIQVNTANQ